MKAHQSELGRAIMQRCVDDLEFNKAFRKAMEDAEGNTTFEFNGVMYKILYMRIVVA